MFFIHNYATSILLTIEAAKLYLKDNTKIADEIDKKIREMVASGKKLPKEIGEEEKEE